MKKLANITPWILPLIAWIVFILIPLSSTILLTDNFIIIKWIVGYLSAFCFCILFYTKKSILAPNKKWIFLVTGLVLLRLVLLSQRTFSIEIFSFYDALLFVFMVITTSQSVNSQEYLLTISRTPFFLGLTFVLSRSLVQFYTHRFVEGNFSHETFASSFGNVNMLAEYLLLTLPLQLKYQEMMSDFLDKIFQSTIFVLSLFILYWIQSRSAFIGLFFLATFLTYKKEWTKLVWSLFGITAILIVSLNIYWSDNEFEFLKSSKNASTASRQSLIESSINIMSTKPFGIGSELFEFYIAPYKLETPVHQSEGIFDRSPHNEILRWGIEFGWLYLFGILLFGFYLASMLKKISNSWLSQTFIILLPQILFQFPFQNAFPFFFIALVMGLAISQSPIIFKLDLPQKLIQKISIFVAVFSFFILISFGLSKFWEVNSLNNLSKSKWACKLYPINWRSCVNEAHVHFNNGNNKESLHLIKAELIRHPFNIIALKFAILNQLKLGNKDLACEGAQIYENILGMKGQYYGFLKIACNHKNKDQIGQGYQFEKYYFNWIKTTPIFEI